MHWYYTKEVTDSKTPSRADGVDVDMEMRYRKEGARFIMELGNKLGLRYLTMATGIVFYHRFYMNQSFKNFSRWVTGTACLFLAGKVEETPKKCKDVLRTCRQMLSDHQWEAFGENPREEVMMHERILLQTIKFDLQVDHPYQYLIKYGKGLKGDKERINELVQKAWIFINDSLSTCICLQYKPPVVALAMLHLAAKLSKQSMQNFTPVPRQDWWRHFSPEIEQSVLDDICNEMMDLYDSSRRKSKLREGSGSKSKDGSMTDSPAYTPSASPQVSGSPPAKKKRNMSASIADANKPKDSPLAKPPQVENVSPPISMKLSQASTQPTQPMTLPSTQTIPTSQTHGHYFQHGFKFMGIPQKDVLQVGQDLVQQQQNTRQPMMSTAQLIQNQQALGNVYGHGIPMHNQGIQSSQGIPSQVISQSQGMPPSQGIPQHGTPHGHMMPREQMPLTVDQGHYAYSMAQQQQQPQQQQQHMHSYAPSQMPPVSQWQAQQQGIGPGWMK